MPKSLIQNVWRSEFCEDNRSEIAMESNSLSTVMIFSWVFIVKRKGIFLMISATDTATTI